MFVFYVFIYIYIFLITKNEIIKTFLITVGITFYHFFMRLTIGSLIDFIVKNKVNYKRKWFCNKKFENKLYHFLQVKKWKSYLPTYTPDAFDISKKKYL